MKVLIVGSGGREHALAWKLSQSDKIEQIFVAPGNAGTARERRCSNLSIPATDLHGLSAFALQQGVDLTVVGPEAPLVAGIVDHFLARGLRIFGPTQRAAQLEGSKTFAKNFMQQHGIPTARYGSFTDIDSALAHLHTHGAPIVVKADGLAAGKGVILAQTEAEAEAAIRDMLAGNVFGDAGHRVVLEEMLQGEEASFICILDGEHILPLATSQDHKAREDGDRGPNTGGMGAYSPAPVITAELHQRILEEVMEPVRRGMAAEGIPYSGFLYAGLMIDAAGNPRVLEFNCRFGDPETQPILLRLRSDLLELLLAATDGSLDQHSAEWDPRFALGVVLVAEGYPMDYRRGDVITGLDETTENLSSIVFHAGTRHDAHGAVVTDGGRVLCVTGLGDTIRQAKQHAYSRVSSISFSGMQFRSDIGYRAMQRE